MSILELLTPREHEVAQLLLRGLTNKEVGQELGISPRTAELHRARVAEKTGTKNIAELHLQLRNEDLPVVSDKEWHVHQLAQMLEDVTDLRRSTQILEKRLHSMINKIRGTF